MIYRHDGFIYVYRGEGVFGPDGVAAKEGQMLLLDAGDEVLILAAMLCMRTDDVK